MIEKCEYCGENIIYDNEGSLDVEICFTSREEGRSVVGEYNTDRNEIGTMCGACATKILNEIQNKLQEIGLVERYEKVDKEKLKTFIQEKEEGK